MEKARSVLRLDLLAEVDLLCICGFFIFSNVQQGLDGTGRDVLRVPPDVGVGDCLPEE